MSEELGKSVLREPTGLARSRSRYKGSRPSLCPASHRLEADSNGKIIDQGSKFPKSSANNPHGHELKYRVTSGGGTGPSAPVKRPSATHEPVATPSETSSRQKNHLKSAFHKQERRGDPNPSEKLSGQPYHGITGRHPQPEYAQQLKDRRARQDDKPTIAKTTKSPASKVKKQSPLAGTSKTEPTSSTKPDFDAPISAVNAGERRVAVEYMKTVISVAITPSTTCTDLIHEASEQLGVPLDTQEALLLESFRQLGLERPLRMYENVRSVLNSWDFDAQNSLILMTKVDSKVENEFSAHPPNERRLQDVSATMYYSQRPRHWDKQTFVLRTDGQVLMIKKGGQINVCHLSDFDIYIPTRKQLSKSVKPPKKLCFAIKSQEKSSMFLSTDNFVHFFCTKDKDVAKLWYTAVQGWRSWYLTTVMGQDGKKVNLETAKISEQQLKAGEGARAVQYSNPPQSPDQMGQGTDSPRSRQFLRASRPSADPAFEYHKSPTTHSSRDPFSSTGLLGRTYTRRKQVQEQKMAESAGQEARKLQHPPQQPDTSKLSEIRHAAPLVDLTPGWQEPPQHRKGRGITPEIMPAGGLIEAATSPDIAIPLPPSRLWKRGDPVTAGIQRSGTTRTRKQPWNTNKEENTSERVPKNHETLTRGLVCTDVPSQGDLGHGRGVRTGDRNATSPLMDVHERSRYLPGSLLASVEKHTDAERRPIIARERTKEVNVAVGEA